MPRDVFPVDPQLLARIRRLRRSDAPAVAALHGAAMGTSLWAQLGFRFLRTLYETLVELPDFLGFVYIEEECVRGFIAGSLNTKRMMQLAWCRHGLRLFAAMVLGLLRRPSALWPLLQTLFYFRRSNVPGLDDVEAESLFCSFEPELRGMRISGLINKVFFDELAARRHRFVKITNEADNVASIRQLTNWGFNRLGEFDFYGKRMIAWRLDLQASERITPLIRIAESPQDET